MQERQARTKEETKTEQGKAHVRTRGGRIATSAIRVALPSYMYRTSNASVSSAAVMTFVCPKKLAQTKTHENNSEGDR